MIGFNDLDHTYPMSEIMKECGNQYVSAPA